MEICVKCFFDNKPEFDMAFNYLEPIMGSDIEYNDNVGDLYIETYRSITQAQLNGLTALCPIKLRRKISREAIYNRIAYLIGIFGADYHPDDDVRDLAPESSSYEYLAHLEVTQNDIGFMCDALGLDPCAIALEVLTDLGINPLED